MANKPDVGTIASGARYLATDLNDKFDTLETAIEGCLGRGGTGESPNSMTGNLDMDSNKIQNVGTPGAAADAATKGYVDTTVATVSGATAGTVLIDLASPADGDGADLVANVAKVHNVLSYGADETGATDSRDAFVNAIAASIADRSFTVGVPRGDYLITSTITITDRHVRIVGAAGVRNDATHNGSAIKFSGTGPLFQLGTSDASDWDAGLYNGPQGLYLEHLYLTTTSQDTALANSLSSYEAGTYGVRDWRGGHVQMVDVWIEKFEYGFHGVNSDINFFERTRFLYNKVGVYLGPRSDQFYGIDGYTIGNDTAVWIDNRVLHPLFKRWQFVEDGSATTPPIKIGSVAGDQGTGRPWDIGWYGISFQDCWFERQGVNLTQIDAFIEVGITDDVGTGRGLLIENPHILNVGDGTAGHVDYIALVDKADRIVIRDPDGVTSNNLIRLAKTTGTGSPDLLVESYRQWDPTQTDGGMDNDSSGSPLLHMHQWGDGANFLAAGTTGRLYLSTSASDTTKRMYISPETANTVSIVMPGYAGGQTTRVKTRRVFDLGNRTAAPTTDTWERGDLVINQTPSPALPLGWVCVTGGSPGTWIALNPGSSNGATASRPTLSANDIGYTYWDTTLGKMIAWNGAAWLNVDGTSL